MKQTNNVLPQSNEETGTMSGQRRRGITWVEHSLNLVNVVVQDLSLGISVQQAEALRQSILKKAFSGQLVPQDPHEEPALALLARIQAVRETPSVKPRKASTGNKLLPVENPLAAMNKET